MGRLKANGKKRSKNLNKACEAKYLSIFTKRLKTTLQTLNDKHLHQKENKFVVQ